jgi:hypothetical protein
VNLDLVGTVRLLHRVFGFLAQQSAEQLADIAEGRRRIVSVSDDSARPATVAVTSVVQAPAPPTARSRTATAPRAKQVSDLIDGDYAEVAAELRRRDTVDDGTEYLDGLKLRGRKPKQADFLEIGRQMGLTLPKSTSIPVAKRRLVEHAIGARKKYADLQSW